MIDAGVLLLCFDVPSVTKKDAKLYRSLQRELHEAGFVRVQESVYVKLLRHYEGHMTEMARLKERLPAVGKMFILPLRLSQLKELCTVSGDPFPTALFSDDFVRF